MKLFTNRVTMRGTPVELMGFHGDMQQFVSETIGREVAVWQASLGAPTGTVMYTLPVAGLAELGELTATLGANPEYSAKVAPWLDRQVAPAETSLATMLVGELGEERPPVGACAVVTSVLIANGAYEGAIGWGAEMAEYASGVGGVPIMFTMDGFGAFGRVNWVSVAPDAATADAALDALTADAGYVERLGQTTDLFIPGSGERILGTRFA